MERFNSFILFYSVCWDWIYWVLRQKWSILVYPITYTLWLVNAVNACYTTVFRSFSIVSRHLYLQGANTYFSSESLWENHSVLLLWWIISEVWWCIKWKIIRLIAIISSISDWVTQNIRFCKYIDYAVALVVIQSWFPWQYNNKKNA